MSTEKRTLIKAKGSIPLYIQIRDLFAAKISAGEWPPGEIIPSEVRLCRQLGVSQGTVRQAIGELVENNVLMRKQGLGTFVAHHDHERDLFHFFHIADRQGHKVLPDSETLSLRRKIAAKKEIEQLRLDEGAGVYVIRRIRKLDGRPTLLETITLPEKPFARLGELQAEHLPNTLYALYEKEFGVTIHRADERLHAVAAGARDAGLLNIEPGTALLEIERIAYTLNGTPVELRKSLCMTDRHHYQNTIW